MSELPSGTVTFLFTDIEGSTTLLQRLGDRRYAEVLEEHRQVLRAAFAEGKGKEIDTQGDAFLVVFSRARDALGTAVAAQRALTTHAWPDGASLRVRMGLHTGEPLSGESGYVGIDVHRAARIAAAGHGGQILVSDVTHGLVARDLPEGVSLRDLGAHRLKDLDHPHNLFQVVATHLPSDFPAVRSLDTHPHNLPVQLTSFVDRVREIAEIRRVLATGRLVTLAGTGGAGKTRLALQAAADALEGCPDGVWLAEFAPIADPALVPKTVASVLRVPEQPGRDMIEALIDALRTKALLLILDNCEHLLAACAELAVAVLRACPHVRILATSREGLRVPGEVVCRVPSLSVPKDIRHLPPSEELVLYDAVRLFVDRALATAPGFTVTNENAPAVAQVCRQLDGIPLAIELAAARVKVLTMEQIAARLNDRFRLLTGGSRIAPRRQQTLRGVMDWSYDLLTDPERALLRRLSVFVGGWTLEAAESVCAGGIVEAADFLDLLTSLVDKSLVLAETQSGEARYRFLETVRQYAHERMMEAGEEAEVPRRHRAWYLAFAEQSEVELHGPRQRISLEQLEVEHDNLRGALKWSTENDPADELRLASALYFFWYVRGYFEEGRGWLEIFLKSARDAPGSLRAKALNGAGVLAGQGQGDYTTGRLFCEESLAVARELGDKRGIARALNTLGVIASDQGDQATAHALLQEKLALERDLGDRWGVALSLMNQGLVARRRGDLAAARTLYQEAIALYRELNDQQHLARVLHNLAFVARLQGDLTLHGSLCAESLTIRRSLGDKKGIADSFDSFSARAMVEGQAARAARLLGAADALRETIGFIPSPAYLATHTPEVARVRSALGDGAFATAWAEGRAMTLEQAIEYALAVEVGQQ